MLELDIEITDIIKINKNFMLLIIYFPFFHILHLLQAH